MRKKLLALMMCATMVLSTATTAFAGISTADARKVYGSNYDKFAAEMYPAMGYIINKVDNVGCTEDYAGEVEYGYVKDDTTNANFQKYNPVVVWKDSSTYKMATKLVTDEPVYAFEVNQSPAANLGGGAKIDSLTDLQNIFGSDLSFSFDEDGDTPVKKETAKTAFANVSIYAKVATEKYVKVVDFAASPVYTGASGLDYVSTGETQAIVEAAVGAQTKDGYYVATVHTIAGGFSNALVQKTGASAAVKKSSVEYVSGTHKFVKYGDTKVLKGTSALFTSAKEDEVVYANIEKAAIDDLSLKFAIDNGDISKDAVAVKMETYLQMAAATETLGLEVNDRAYSMNNVARVPLLFGATKFTEGTFTIDSDLISRTAFKDAEAVKIVKVTGFENRLDNKGNVVKSFDVIATAKVEDNYSFVSPASWSDGIYVFDKGDIADVPTEEAATEEETTTAEEATTVATTEAATTAEAANEKSPQMGDTTPIAALAVVMMGAVGAMVVASKKRA